MSPFSFPSVGSRDTAREIAQQPAVWGKVMDLLDARGPQIARFLQEAGATGSGDARLLLTGAGSSDFIGRAVAPTLRRRLGRETTAVPTTHFVTHPGSHFCPGRPYVVIHFARSGDSPESIAAFRFLRRARPDARHLVITCNEEGALRREAAEDASALVLTLPPETNDRSLAMTSSFTSMALCALGLCWPASELRTLMRPVQAGTRRILEEHAGAIEGFAGRDFSRALYLGSNALAGVMHEAALKMLEMTAGRVATTCDSFLGVRHGPQVFVDDRCVVVACLSSEPRVRRYEQDLLRELRGKRQGCGVLALSAVDDAEARGLVDELLVLGSAQGGPVDELRVLTDIVACQVLAFFASRRLGLMPDNPSPGGVINRVVQGVTIYDP